MLYSVEYVIFFSNFLFYLWFIVSISTFFRAMEICNMCTCAVFWCAGRRWEEAGVGGDLTDLQTRTHDSCRSISDSCKSRWPPRPPCCPQLWSCCFSRIAAHTRLKCHWTEFCWLTRWNPEICCPAVSWAGPPQLWTGFYRSPSLSDARESGSRCRPTATMQQTPARAMRCAYTVSFWVRWR